VPPHLALFVYIIFIFGLLWVDCRRDIPVSPGLWVPTIWLTIIGSRPLSLWFTSAPVSAHEAQLEGSPIERLVYLTLIFAGLFILSRRKERFSILGLVSANKAIFVLLAYFALSLLWSEFPFVAFKRYVKTLGMLIMILIILSEVDPELALRTSIRRCGFVLLPLSLMLAKYFPSIGVSYDIWTGVPSLTGVAITKNMLGQICMLFGLVYLWSLVLEWKQERFSKYSRLVLAIDTYMLLLTINLLLKSNSATSLVCLLFGSAILLGTRYDFVRKKTGFFIIAGLLTFLFLSWFSDIIPGMVQSLGRDTTLTGRTGIWQRLLPMAKQNLWFGKGYNMFWTPKILDMMQVNEAHNGYLEIVLNTGLVGLFLFFLFILSAYGRCKQAIISNPRFGRFAMSLFWTSLLYNISESAFRGIDMVYMLFLAISFRLSETEKEYGVYGCGVPALYYSTARREAHPQDHG